MSKFKVGVVGCGRISSRHLMSVAENENCELVAVCDNKPERAKEAGEKYGCKYYTDYNDLVNNKDIDVIHICTPHYMHPIIAIAAMNAGKHVLTEKPMSIELKDAEAMCAAARKNGVTLGVIFQNRYNAGSKLIKKYLDNGELGKIYAGKLEVTWKRTDEYYSKSDWKGTWDKEGGGVIIDQAIHTLDLMNWFVNDEIEYVDANIANRAHKIIKVEDSANGVIKYKNGVLVAFNAINYYSYDAPVKIELHCENGIASMTRDKAQIVFNDARTITAETPKEDTADFGNGVMKYWGSSHKKQITNFYDALKKGIQPDINGENALITQKFICAIYESGKSEKRVIF
ncbi:MAG: Gfo/Idh/MocA family oxidoreductase [Bacillota bacterium]|nr:Gfo/Idh/MocA family oxidoreductase [Bacillota bacterium]